MAKVSADDRIGGERPGPGSPPRRSLSPRPSDQVVDLRAMIDRVRRLSRLDPTVFAEVRDDTSQTLAAILIAVIAVLLSAVGGWLWLIIDVDGLSAGRIAVREFLLGATFAFALWLGWVVIAHLTLTAVFNRGADRARLLRTMGYATLPAAATLLMVIPAVSFAVGLLSMMAWFAMSNAALESAVPDATRKEVLVANIAGFSLFAVIMSLLANAAGLAPGFFAQAADPSIYA